MSVLVSTSTKTTVALLAAGIKNSAMVWKEHPHEMQAALAKYDEVLNATIKGHNGRVFSTPGNALYAAFDDPHQALMAAYESLVTLAGMGWEELGEALQVGMALHYGEVIIENGKYSGPAIQRIKRIHSVGATGTILVSPPVREKLDEKIFPGKVSLVSTGEHTLQDLTRPQTLYEVRGELLPQAKDPIRSLNNYPQNLPVYPTPLIGRENEVSQAVEMLSRRNVRLITFTGPGGTGKTRLSQQVAAEMLFEFSDGVFLVELAGIHQANQVATAISRTLGLQETSGRELLENLKTYLREHQVLLVLDNFEQVAAAAPLVSELLAAAPRLKILVSSRIVLKIYGEQEFRVAPLQLLGPGVRKSFELSEIATVPAVELMVERVRQVLPNFNLTEQNAPVIVEICARLDGLPLAIELVAVRFKMFKPEIILSGLTNRLQLLVGEGEGREGLARQQTMRGAIEWSYNLLEEGEKVLFARLGVFAGGFNSEVAERVCNPDFDSDLDTLDDLTSLIDHSLVRMVSISGEDEPRFGMLETIREFALEKLVERKENAELSESYAAYFLELAEEAEPLLTGADQTTWFKKLALEYPNFREVIEQAFLSNQESSHGLILRLTSALWRFWAARGYITESREWLEMVLIKNSVVGSEIAKTALAQGDGWVSLRAKGYTAAGLLALEEGDFNQAKALLEEALRLQKQEKDAASVSLANTLNALGTVESYQGNLGQALDYHRDCLSLRRRLNDTRGIAISLCNMGALAAAQDDSEHSRAYYEEALSLLRRVGDKRTMALLLNNLGNLWLAEGNWNKAGQATEESRKMYEDLEDRGGVALALMQLGDIARFKNEGIEAVDLYRESLALFEETGEKADLPPCIEGLAAAYTQTGNFNWAAHLYGAAQALREKLNSPLQPADLPRYSEELNTLKQNLNEKDFSAQWAIGYSHNIEEIIERFI